MVVSRALVMVSGVLFARYLGPEQFGLYSFVLSIVAVATLPAIAGLPNLLVREVAHSHTEKNWPLLFGVINWSRLYVLSISALVIVFIYLAVYLKYFSPPISSIMWFAILLVPIRGMLTQQGAVLNGLSEPVLAQLPAQIFAPTFTLIILLICIYSNVTLTSLRLIYIAIFSTTFAYLTSLILLHRTSRPIIIKSAPTYTLKKWHCSLLPFSLMTIITTLNTELGSILLGSLGSTESVAYFKVAMQGVTLITVALLAINTVIMPNIARFYKNNDLEATQELLTRSVRLSMVCTVPIIVVLVAYGDYAIAYLFGDSYAESYVILIVLCIGQLCSSLMGSVAIVLNMTGNEKNSLKSLLITLIVNLILFYIFIPIYGGVGAAIATSFSLILLNVLMTIDVWKLTKLKAWLR